MIYLLHTNLLPFIIQQRKAYHITPHCANSRFHYSWELTSLTYSAYLFSKKLIWAEFSRQNMHFYSFFATCGLINLWKREKISFMSYFHRAVAFMPSGMFSSLFLLFYFFVFMYVLTFTLVYSVLNLSFFLAQIFHTNYATIDETQGGAVFILDILLQNDYMYRWRKFDM
jgi:hypothetical protein